MLINKRELPGILIVHLMPIYGVIFLGWDAYTVVVLYFLETIFIGLFTFIKLFLNKANPSKEEFKEQIKNLVGKLIPVGENQDEALKRDDIKSAGSSSKLGLAVFFLVHYNLFIIVQSVFITSVFTTDGGFLSGIISMFKHVFGQTDSPLFYTGVLMFCNVGFREYYGYIWNNDFKKLHPMVVMFQPYTRIIIQQFVVILGGMVAMFLKAALPFVVLLSAFKIITDIWGLSFLMKLNKSE